MQAALKYPAKPFYEAPQKTSFQSSNLFSVDQFHDAWSLLQINVDCSNAHVHPHRPNVTVAAKDRRAPRFRPARRSARVPGPRQALHGAEEQGQKCSPESVPQTMPPLGHPLAPWALLFLNCQVRESNSVTPRSASSRGLLQNHCLSYGACCKSSGGQRFVNTPYEPYYNCEGTLWVSGDLAGPPAMSSTLAVRTCQVTTCTRHLGVRLPLSSRRERPWTSDEVREDNPHPAAHRGQQASPLAGMLTVGRLCACEAGEASVPSFQLCREPGKTTLKNEVY